MKKFCIVIPIYKEELDCIDKISLKRLDTVISNKYDIYFIKPKGLKTDEYYNLLDKSCTKEIEFKKSYFKSNFTYSQLCLQYSFYNKFSKYEYMYIYQTDCYLVDDKLEFWCNKGYDYIGAPILALDANWKNYDNIDKFKPQVGNGGFSLRKISVFKDLTNPKGEFRQYYGLTDDKLSKVRFEDKYFCNDLYNFYDLSKPNWMEALFFALDMNIDAIYNDFKFKYMPMGIHAWPKNIRYWKNVLEELKDNQEVSDYCEELYKDYFKLYYAEQEKQE